MNIEEIRAKFPQYNDLSDDQLLIGIHRKYYSDVPIQSFLKTVQYKAPDPTEGMSGFDKFAAGFGKAMVDTARGLGQFVGATDRADVAESRRLDAPLMRTDGGLAGNIAGNVAMLAPTAMIPGAATLKGASMIGAASGLASPSESTLETVKNTVLGGALAPAGVMVGRGINSLYQGAKALVEPLTRSGQERIAASVLRSSATDPAAAAATLSTAKPLVPGSNPTIGQAAQDPGLAQLERTLLNNPEYAGPLQQRYAAQRAARLQSVRDVAGTPDYYEAIKEGRRIFANQDYGNAVSQGIDQKMAQAIQPQIESLMRRPSMQEAQRVAKGIAAEKDISLTDFGSIEGLDWIKKALDKQINAIKTGNPIGKTDMQTLLQTKSDLMSTIESIAPAYKEANDAFAAMSRQVNSMDVARSLLDKLNKPGSEYLGQSAKEMGADYARALSMAQESVKKATGQNKSISDVMSTKDIAQLEAVALDLGRKAFAETAGRATGSPTAQNMISQNMLRRMIGPAGLPESWAESTMLQGLLSPIQIAGNVTGANQKVMDRIAMGLLDPQDAAALLRIAPQAMPGLLSSPVQRVLPGVSSGLLSVHLPQ